ncbi:predicted protein [Naegleria gruberi]|uniref:Predicted protein n=1 Tax=Naegleria gruberi TaxID=5762 RepID=D2VF65_NAEGR|nr:uncharacterized protein NAEGRDRAFT_67516 [Naegleria gruberi]EFC44630.1 predicted protein [Naegleria gruberi]|eukprot:XP_002677374.1 predicted protein [Naegleria gruberi strain NEG-M]
MKSSATNASRRLTPIKVRSINDTCQGENCFLSVPVIYPSISNGNNLHIPNTRNRSKTLGVPSPFPSSLSLVQKSTRSNSLELENIQTSTFHGLTTPQSQLMKVLYLSEKDTPTEESTEAIPQPKKESNHHLTVDTFVNSSASSSSCDSFLSLTFSSNPQTPTIPENQEPQSPKEDASDQVISEGQIISSIFVEIVRYLILPFFDFLIYLIGFMLNQDDTPTIHVIKASGSNCSTKKLSNNVGDLLHNHFNPPRISGELSDKKFVKEISFQIPETKEEESLFQFNLFQHISHIRNSLFGWLSTHNKTLFTRNGKSCRALVRNEVKHLNTLATCEFSQAKSLTDLIEYWKKSMN